MKANHRQGHSVNCRGARGYLDEVAVVSKVNIEFGRYLEKNGSDGVDCTSTKNNVNDDLSYGISRNNNNKADFYIPIHANMGGGTGAEIWLYPTASKDTQETAKRILKRLEQLGFRNRGLKFSSGLYDLRKSNNKAMLIELFFLDNKNDCDLYNKLGPKLIAKAIAEGLLNKDIVDNTNNNTNGKGVFRVVVGSYSVRSNAEKVQADLKAKGFDSFLVYEEV